MRHPCIKIFQTPSQAGCVGNTLQHWQISDTSYAFHCQSTQKHTAHGGQSLTASRAPPTTSHPGPRLKPSQLNPPHPQCSHSVPHVSNPTVHQLHTAVRHPASFHPVPLHPLENTIKASVLPPPPHSLLTTQLAEPRHGPVQSLRLDWRCSAAGPSPLPPPTPSLRCAHGVSLLLLEPHGQHIAARA